MKQTKKQQLNKLVDIYGVKAQINADLHINIRNKKTKNLNN